MRHGDTVTALPPGFVTIGKTSSIACAAFGDESRRTYGVQFHPEVEHTLQGRQILANFLFKIAGCEPGWTMGAFIRDQTREIRKRVGREKVLCAVSGGVDSSVMATLWRGRWGGTSLPSLSITGCSGRTNLNW